MADALSKLLAEQSSWDGYDLGVDLSAMAKGGEVGGAAAVSYVGKAMTKAWGALPRDIRSDAIDALQGFFAELLQDSQLLEDIGEAISEGISGAFEGIPIVEFIVKVIVTFVGIGTVIDEMNADQSKFNRARGRASMFDHEQYAFMVYRAPEIRGFPYWVFGDGETVRWRWRASLEPDQGAAAYWFGHNIIKPRGKWSKTGGMALKCPTFQGQVSEQYYGCRRHDKGNKADEFKGYTFVNALAWPYWSPNFPSVPMSVYQSEGSKGAYDFDGIYIDPNAELVRGQMMLLLDAHTNFQVSASHLANTTAHFMERWRKLLFVENGFCGIIDDEEEKIARDFQRKLTPDAKRDKFHTADPDATRFYFGADGIVRVYPGFEAEEASGELDLANVGVNTPLPVSPGKGYACSLADYNAIVSSTRAFFTARRAFLLNHSTCAGIVKGKRHIDYREDVKAAVVRSAKMHNPYTVPGGLGLSLGDAEQPTPKAGGKGFDDGRRDRPGKSAAPRRPGEGTKDNAAAGAALGIGGLLLLLLLF